MNSPKGRVILPDAQKALQILSLAESRIPSSVLNMFAKEA